MTTTTLDLTQFEAQLPAPPAPVGSYVPLLQVGNLLYTSGTLPMKDGQLLSTGQVGGYTTTLEDGQAAARQCILNAMALVKAHVGSLSQVKRIVKLTGFVSSMPNFYDQPKVINAASDLLVEVFGDVGKHVRSAVGVASLPLNAPVEIELIVEI